MEHATFRAVDSNGKIQGRSRGVPFALELTGERRPRKIKLCLEDGYQSTVYVHSPRGSGRLPVLYMHGIQSHPGWFVGSAAHLADCGHPVFQVTRRGSGDSDRHRGHARSAGQILRDVNTACRFAMKETDAEGIHIVGPSWGGKLAAAWATWKKRIVDPASVTMVCPGIAPRVDVGFVTKLGIFLSVLSAPRRPFDIPLNEVELFTDNEAMRDYLRHDGLRLHRATARFLCVSKVLDCMLMRAPRGAMAMPTALMLASRDDIIDNAATRKVVERLTAGRAVVKEFDAAHVLDFEPDPQPFYAALGEAIG